MNVLVDTSVWSLAFRRSDGEESSDARELRTLVEEGRAEIIGPIRQELLTGISQPSKFENLRVGLSAFEDIPLQREHFEIAAGFSNRCRKHGVQGSPIDFLICSVAASEHLAIFTKDKDFLNYSKWLPIKLHHPTL